MIRIARPFRQGPVSASLTSRLAPLTIKRNVKTSTVDWKPFKSKKRSDEGGASNGIFFGLLCLMPVVSAALGTWQVKRLKWKQELISRAENSLALPTLPLPPILNPNIVEQEFDFRRVTATGTFRHDQEMLVGPRLFDGEDGYYVVTPLERKDGSKLLVFRGWIAKRFKEQSSRPESLIRDEVTIECMLRKKPAKNFFTPNDEPEKGNYYFMSIDDMAASTGSQPVYIQALMDLTYNGKQVYPEQLIARGIPIGKPPKVEFRNTHFQYIVTWYGLSVLTTVMLFFLVKQRREAMKFGSQAKAKHARKIEG